MAQVDPALARHNDDAFPTLEHLFDAGDAVAQLQGHPGWAAVQAVLQSEIDAIGRTMDGLKPLDQATYAMRHGRIGGLRAAQGTADAIVAEATRRRSEQQAQHEGGAESSPER